MSEKTIKTLSTEFQKTVPTNKGQLIKMHVTAEEQIIDEQIRKLQILSQAGSLDLEDIKKLDLLIKNKRLCNDQSTLNADFNRLPDNTTDAELLSAAEGTDVNAQDTAESSQKDSVE